jgi:hypothetical protein
MRLRFALGDRVGALRAYATCRAVLDDELQIEPEPETMALAKHLRHTTPFQQPPSRPPHPSARQESAHLLDSPLIGRSTEFGTLIDRYQRVHTGQPQFVLLQGESGIGKTRLANEFVRWAQAQGANVLAGRVLQTERQLPYQPFIGYRFPGEMMREVVCQEAGTTRQRLMQQRVRLMIREDLDPDEEDLPDPIPLDRQVPAKIRHGREGHAVLANTSKRGKHRNGAKDHSEVIRTFTGNRPRRTKLAGSAKRDAAEQGIVAIPRSPPGIRNRKSVRKMRTRIRGTTQSLSRVFLAMYSPTRRRGENSRWSISTNSTC